MNQRSRITGHTASTTPHSDEALRRTVADSIVHPRRLLAVGVKRGNSPFTVKAVNA